MARKAKAITVITDPLLEPYYITKDDLCYTVNERIIPNKDHFRSKGNGKEYAKPQGYYPEFGQAIKIISDELRHTKRKYDSLIEYIEEYRVIENNIKEYTDGIRSTI